MSSSPSLFLILYRSLGRTSLTTMFRFASPHSSLTPFLLRHLHLPRNPDVQNNTPSVLTKRQLLPDGTRANPRPGTVAFQYRSSEKDEYFSVPLSLTVLSTTRLKVFYLLSVNFCFPSTHLSCRLLHLPPQSRNCLIPGRGINVHSTRTSVTAQYLLHF